MTAKRPRKASARKRVREPWPPGSIRNRVFGTIGVAWGGGILVHTSQTGVPIVDSAAGAGSMLGVLTGLALFLVGMYFLIRG